MPIRGSPNGARHPRPQAVAIDRNRWSRSIGMTGRNQSERLVAIIRCAQPTEPRPNTSPGRRAIGGSVRARQEDFADRAGLGCRRRADAVDQIAPHTSVAQH